MSEIWTDKESCPTDLSPTAIFLSAGHCGAVCLGDAGGGMVYPGCGMAGWGREVYTGVLPSHASGPQY